VPSHTTPSWSKEGINRQTRGADGKLSLARCTQCRSPLERMPGRQVYVCHWCGYKVSEEDLLRSAGGNTGGGAAWQGGRDEDRLRPDKSEPWGKGAAGVKGMASHLLNRREYSRYLELLEGQPLEVFGDTHTIEDLLLNMLKDIRLRRRSDREFSAEIEMHEPRILGLMKSVLWAKSLDVSINRSLGPYWSLVDYVSRVRLGEESMLDDPEFWPWLDSNYANTSRFLRTDGRRVRKTNDLVQVLSTHFRARKDPRSKAYMRAVDGICREATVICSGHACDYAKKADESWSSAAMEMTVLVALNRNFRIARIDPSIPGSGRRADVSFVHEGAEHYVEVYSRKSYALAAPQIKMDIDPKEEWDMRFGKAQIRDLRAAGVPTVYVMRLDDFQALPGETKSQAFCDAARKTMPRESEIVVVLRGIEAASLRDGQVVGPSDLAVRLGAEIWAAMPETVADAELRALPPA